jgi:diguanylate cyclase (GGDEF)-like protein
MSASFISLIFVGMAMLGLSLAPIRSMLRMIGAGRLRSAWIALRALIVGFLIGYGCFGLLQLETEIGTPDLVVALILTAGGAFVLTVSHLSYQTAHDIVRIASLERDVIHDPLTGIFNRRYLDARLEEEVVRARRYKLELSTLLIDLDHFKRINDTYGHHIGDLVLRRTCALIARMSRPNDTVARYGGEEIVVVAPHSTSEAAEAFAERLRRLIAEESIDLPDGRGTIAITASIGVASLSTNENSANLLQRADGAMYQAKHLGRDRVCKAIEQIA